MLDFDPPFVLCCFFFHNNNLEILFLIIQTLKMPMHAIKLGKRNAKKFADNNKISCRGNRIGMEQNYWEPEQK